MDDAARAAHGIDSLPGSLIEAVGALEADALLCDALGEHVRANYVAGKRAEWDAYRTAVTDWEIKRYSLLY